MKPHAFAAFDEATIRHIIRLEQRPIDRFGEPIMIGRPVAHDRVLRALAQCPKRVRQIVVELEARRASVEAALDELLRRGHVTRDVEAFYALAEPQRH